MSNIGSYINAYNSHISRGAVFAKNMVLPFWVIPIAAFAGFVFLVFLGCLDHKYILEKEQEFYYEKVPQINKILENKK